MTCFELKNTMNKPITIKELEKLIKICKNMGVSTLEFGNIKISMGSPEQQLMTPAPQVRVSAKKVSQITEKAELQSQLEGNEDALGTMHVEDPSGYEALLMQGALGEKENH